MPDNDFINSISKDDKGAFNSLVSKYYESLNAFVFHFIHDREAAGDIVQDVFANLWINRHKIDLGVPLKNYLYVATRNHTYNYIRSSKRSRERLRNIDPGEHDPDLFMIEEEVNRILAEALAQLPQRNAEVISMSLEGVKQQEIADRLGISLATVKMLKAASIKKLKEIIGPMAIFILL